MKHLFMVRHGKYNELTGNLTYWGREQIHKLAREMKRVCGGLESSFYLTSSTAARAQQTAKIISDAFGSISIDADARLCNEEEELTDREIEVVNGLIVPHRDRYEVIAISTHYSVVKSYSEFLLKDEFGKRDEEIEPESGQAVHFDWEAKKFQILPR